MPSRFAEQRESLLDADVPHILVVDDNPEDVRTIIQNMHREGWKVSVVDDARQGLQRATVLRPNLVLLDLNMPHMDGFTFCRLLRETDGTQRIPVIFLSAESALDKRLTGFKLGAVDYVLKPYERREVIARVRVHLHLASQSHQSSTSEAELPSAQRANSEDQLLLRAATRLISENLSDLPSLVDIARQVGTHDKRLSRLFREHLGTTVFAYARDLRLRKSQELLVQGSMTVQDIAEWVGYGSACNFTTAFRQKTGVTPSQFRQQSNAESLD